MSNDVSYLAIRDQKENRPTARWGCYFCEWEENDGSVGHSTAGHVLLIAPPEERNSRELSKSYA